MMAVRKKQNQGIHPGSFEKTDINDNEDDDEDDEDNHFIISLEDNGEEDGLLCNPEDISFSTSNKQTLGDSPDVTKQLTGEHTPTSRYTNHSDLNVQVHNKVDNFDSEIFTFPTSITPKNQNTLNNSELAKISSSDLSSTCVNPESSSIQMSSSNNNSYKPRESIHLVNPQASPKPSYPAWNPNYRTSESLHVNEGENYKSQQKSDSLNSQSIEDSNQNGLLSKKCLVSNNFSSNDMGLETIKLGVESGGIWSEAIFLTKTQNGPHGIYPFCVSNNNTSVCGDKKTDPQKPSNLHNNINVQNVYSSGQTILTNSSTSSLPALSALKPSDSLSFSSPTLSSQLTSCAPRLSGPYPKADIIQGKPSGPDSSTVGVPESNLPESNTDSSKHNIVDDTANCTCIMCYKSSCPNKPDPKNVVVDLEKIEGGVDVKVGTNNKRKRVLVLQKARKKKQAGKFVDIYVIPQENNANNVGVNNLVQLKINESDNADLQSKILGNNLRGESSKLLSSPMIRPHIVTAGPALPRNTVSAQSSSFLNRTLASSQMTTGAMTQVSASSPKSLKAKKVPQKKQFKVTQSFNRPIAPKMFVSLSEVLGKDETSCAVDSAISVVGTSLTSNISIPSHASKEKPFFTSSLATLRSLKFKYLHDEAVHNPQKRVKSKQPSQLCASQQEAEHLSHTSVKVNPPLISNTEASKSTDKSESPGVIVLKDAAHLKILNKILKKHQWEIRSPDKISTHLQNPKALKVPVSNSNNSIKSHKITVLTEPPREPIYTKSLLSPKPSTAVVSTNFSMHCHTASTTATSVPSISVAPPILHTTQPQCTFISSFQRQPCVRNKNLVYSILKDNFQTVSPTSSNQMVTVGQPSTSKMVTLTNKLPHEKEASHREHDLKILGPSVKAENCVTPGYENESFGSSCNTPTPHPPEERLPKSYIEDWVNQAKTYICETLKQEPQTLHSDPKGVRSKPVHEEVTSIHNYTKRASSIEQQLNLAAEVNHDDGTRTTLILPVAPKLKQTTQTPASLGLSSTPGNTLEEVLLSHSLPSAGMRKSAMLNSIINHSDSVKSSSLTNASMVGESSDGARANNLLSSSDSIDCLQESCDSSPTKVAKSNAFNKCLTGGRSRLLSQSRKRNTVFNSSLGHRRTTSSSVVPSSNGIKLKIRFDPFHKKTLKTLDPLNGIVAESASETAVLENEHLDKDKQKAIKDSSEIMSSAPKPILVETFGDERIETAEEMFQRFQKQAMQEVFKAQSGVGSLSRNLRPARTSIAFLDKPLWRLNLESSKKKKREEVTYNLSSKTDDASSIKSAFSKDSGDKRLSEGNKKRHLSEDESVSVKQARLSIKDYPKLKEDNSISNKKKVVCSNILAGHQVYVKFNTYENIHTGRCFLVPFFNIGGTRTQFDVEDMEYISRAVVDYEKEEKSCARHLLFHAREEENKASFLRKENYHHSSKITEKNYKKCSFVLEGFQRHASKPAEPVVERWTVDNTVDIEIDRAEVDPDEEEHFASMIESRSTQLDAVSGTEFFTLEEDIFKSNDNVNSGIDIDMAEGDFNAEKEFTSQIARSSTDIVDNDNITQHPLENQLELLKSSNGISRSSHPHILKSNLPAVHNVLKESVSSTFSDRQEWPSSKLYISDSKSISSKKLENNSPVLSANTLSQSEDRGISGVVHEAELPHAVSQNSIVIKTEVLDTGYGDMSSYEHPPETCESMVRPGAPFFALVKDEPIDECFETLSTLVTSKQVVQDPTNRESTSDVVESNLTNLLEPSASTTALSSMTSASKVQLVSNPITVKQVASQPLNIPFDHVSKIAFLEPTVAVSPDVPSMSLKLDNNVSGKTNSTIIISDRSITENSSEIIKTNRLVVNDVTETAHNNKPVSFVRCENLMSLVATDAAKTADQFENITTPIREICNETVSPVASEATVTADEIENTESPLPSSSMSESSDISSSSDIEDLVADEHGQIETMSHSECPSPDKQNPVQSKITSLVESLRQRLTQQTPSLPTWLSTDTVPRVRSKIKLRSKDKSRKTTLDSNENLDVAKDPISNKPLYVTCELGTKLLHSPVYSTSTSQSIQNPATSTVESIQNPVTQSMLFESAISGSTLLPHTSSSVNESLLPNSSAEPVSFPFFTETLQPNVLSVPSVTKPCPFEHSINDVLTETMHLPVISPGKTKTQSVSESSSIHDCLLSKGVELFSKVQPLSSLPASISCEANASTLTLPQKGAFSVLHPNQASSSYTLPTATNSIRYIPQTSSFSIPTLSHSKNNVEDTNFMCDTQQVSLPYPPVPILTLDSNRSTPSDFEIEVGTEDNFEDDVTFRPIQPKLRKLSWKDYAAPYSRLVPTNLSDSPPISPWGLPSGRPSNSSIFYQNKKKSLADNSVLTNQHAKNMSRNISKRGKKVKTFKGKRSTEKKIPVTSSALDEFTPTESAESVTSYLTKKFSSTPGSKIKGPRLLHDPSKKKVTLQKSESDSSLTPASQVLPGPISTAELSKTPSLSEIFGIEIKNSAKSSIVVMSAKSQVEAKGGASKNSSQVAKKRTSQVTKKKRSQVARKRTSFKKKGLDAFNSKSDVTDKKSDLKVSDRLETAAPENIFKLISPESQDVIQHHSDNLELRLPATCDIKNELLTSLDDNKQLTCAVTKSRSNAESLSNLPDCTVVLHKLEDLKHSFELIDGVYFVKGAKSKIINDCKPKESGDQSSASKQEKQARKIIKRKKKKSKVTRKQPIVRHKKDIVDYYTSMLESLQKKALQLEEESRKEREEKEKKEHKQKLRKEMEEKAQNDIAEKAAENAEETDEANPNEKGKSGIEAVMDEFDDILYDHNINEDLGEIEQNEEAEWIKPADPALLLTENTVAANEPSKDSSFNGMESLTEIEDVPGCDIDSSDFTSDILVKNHCDNQEGKLSILANKEKLHSSEDGENVGHEVRTNCVQTPQEISLAEDNKDYICHKDPLDEDTVFEKKDIVLCGSFDEEMLKISSCERQKIAAEEDVLLGQAEDFEGDDIGVIPQIEVERLLGLDTNATSPDTLDDFNLELKDQIYIMEQLKDGDLMESEMVEGAKKQSVLKNEGRFLFGDSPEMNISGSLEFKKDNSKTSDPSKSFESALRWVNIPEPGDDNNSPKDSTSLITSEPIDAQVKLSEVQNNFEVQLKFQTASLIKSIKLSTEMKNVFGEATSGGNSPNEDKKTTYENALSQPENTNKSLGNPCTAASSTPELVSIDSPHSRPPIPKLMVKLRRETIEAIEKAKASFVSIERGEKKQGNGSKGKLLSNSDKSAVQLQEDMQFYLRSSNSHTISPGSPVKSQVQLLHSSQNLKRGFPSHRASPRIDSRASRSKFLSPNNATDKVTGLEKLNVNSSFEPKQSTNKTADGIFSSVHLFDESLEVGVTAVSCDTNSGSSVTTKPTQSVFDTNAGSSSVTTRPSQSVKSLVKPLTIDIVKLKMKLNPLFSIKARQNSSETQETKLNPPSNIASVRQESHPSITTSLVESSTNTKNVVTAISASSSENLPCHAAFSNSSPQVVLKKLPTLNTAKLCNILKSFQKQTSHKTSQNTFKGDPELTSFSNTIALLGSSHLTKRSSPRAIRSQKSTVNRSGRALRSSTKNAYVSSTNVVVEESKNVMETRRQSNPSCDLLANPNKQLKETDDKGERSFFDCLTDVTIPSAWVDIK